MNRRASSTGSSQAGFTLIETLVAMVVLTFGLLAVTNLLIMATTDNYAAAQSTAAATAASRQLDFLRTTSFTNLAPGGSLTADVNPALAGCPGLVGNYSCTHETNEPGDPRVQVRWTIVSLPPGGIGITVQAAPLIQLASQRATVELSTIRTCTGVPPVGAAPLCPAIP